MQAPHLALTPGAAAKYTTLHNPQCFPQQHKSFRIQGKTTHAE